MYCKKCGGKLESYASNCAFCGTPVEKYDANVNYVKEEKHSEQKFMSAPKWIGLNLLPAIPVIGVLVWLILMFKWARKRNPDLTLRGYARANLFVMLLVLLLVVGLVVFVVMNPDFLEQLKESLEQVQ